MADETLEQTATTTAAQQDVGPRGDNGKLEEARQRLTESLAARLAALSQLAEPGWQEITAGNVGAMVAQGINRKETNLAAWWYYYNDPTVNQAVRLHAAYVFGSGVAVKAQDERVSAAVQRFWRDPRNRASVTGIQAQWRLIRNALLSGEVFLGLYVSRNTGRVVVRLIDPSEIVEVIPAETDPATPVYYKRVYTPRRYDFQSGRWMNEEQVIEYLPDFRLARVPPTIASAWPDGTEVYIMHILASELAGRGLSYFSPALPWVRALKGFLEDRAMLTIALATFAFQLKVAGNAAALQRVVEQFGEYEASVRYGVNTWQDRRQAANTFISNDAVSLEQVRTDTGAQNAYLDARLLRQQAAIGSGGLMEHYASGDPSTGNLASHTAMELPMLKTFEYWQEFWRGVYRDLLNFVVLQAARFTPGFPARATADALGGVAMWELEPVGDVSLSVDVDFPPIVQRDIAVWAAGLASVAQAEAMTGQALMPPREKAMVALQMFGVDNPEQALAELEDNDFAMPGVTATATAPTAASRQKALRALVNLARVVREAKVGDPLDPSEGEHVDPITQEELDKAFEEFAKLPDLETLIKKFDLDPKEVYV